MPPGNLGQPSRTCGWLRKGGTTRPVQEPTASFLPKVSRARGLRKVDCLAGPHEPLSQASQSELLADDALSALMVTATGDLVGTAGAEAADALVSVAGFEASAANDARTREKTDNPTMAFFMSAGVLGY